LRRLVPQRHSQAEPAYGLSMTNGEDVENAALAIPSGGNENPMSADPVPVDSDQEAQGCAAGPRLIVIRSVFRNQCGPNRRSLAAAETRTDAAMPWDDAVRMIGGNGGLRSAAFVDAMGAMALMPSPKRSYAPIPAGTRRVADREYLACPNIKKAGQTSMRGTPQCSSSPAPGIDARAMAFKPFRAFPPTALSASHGNIDRQGGNRRAKRSAPDSRPTMDPCHDPALPELPLEIEFARRSPARPNIRCAPCPAGWQTALLSTQSPCWDGDPPDIQAPFTPGSGHVISASQLSPWMLSGHSPAPLPP